MNEHELDLTLGAIVLSRTQVTAPHILREHVRAVPFQTPEQRSWLLRPTTRRFQSMFNATKFVVAGVIVALFGGFLLSGVLNQPNKEQLPAALATPSASPVAATDEYEDATARAFMEGYDEALAALDAYEVEGSISLYMKDASRLIPGGENLEGCAAARNAVIILLDDAMEALAGGEAEVATTYRDAAGHLVARTALECNVAVEQLMGWAQGLTYDVANGEKWVIESYQGGPDMALLPDTCATLATMVGEAWIALDAGEGWNEYRDAIDLEALEAALGDCG
jgi:hypothetical protein